MLERFVLGVSRREPIPVPYLLKKALCEFESLVKFENLLVGPRQLRQVLFCLHQPPLKISELLVEHSGIGRRRFESVHQGQTKDAEDPNTNESTGSDHD